MYRRSSTMNFLACPSMVPPPVKATFPYYQFLHAWMMSSSLPVATHWTVSAAP